MGAQSSGRAHGYSGKIDRASTVRAVIIRVPRLIVAIGSGPRGSARAAAIRAGQSASARRKHHPPREGRSAEDENEPSAVDCGNECPSRSLVLRIVWPVRLLVRCTTCWCPLEWRRISLVSKPMLISRRLGRLRNEVIRIHVQYSRRSSNFVDWIEHRGDKKRPLPPSRGKGFEENFQEIVPSAPPAQIWTCPLRHPAPPSGRVDDKPLARPWGSDCQFGPVGRDQLVHLVPASAVLGPGRYRQRCRPVESGRRPAQAQGTQARRPHGTRSSTTSGPSQGDT